MTRPYLLSLMSGKGQLINALFYADYGDLTDKTTWVGEEMANRAGGQCPPLMLSTLLNDDGLAVLRALFVAEGKAELFESLAGNPDRYLIFQNPPDATQRILDLH